MSYPKKRKSLVITTELHNEELQRFADEIRKRVIISKKMVREIFPEDDFENKMYIKLVDEVTSLFLECLEY